MLCHAQPKPLDHASTLESRTELSTFEYKCTLGSTPDSVDEESAGASGFSQTHHRLLSNLAHGLTLHQAICSKVTR